MVNCALNGVYVEKFYKIYQKLRNNYSNKYFQQTPKHVDLEEHSRVLFIGSLLQVIPGGCVIVPVIGGLLLLAELFKNIEMLGLFFGLFILSLIFPPFAIVAVCVCFYLIMKRLDYIETHKDVIGSGIFFYVMTVITNGISMGMVMLFSNIVLYGNTILSAPLVGKKIFGVIMLVGVSFIVLLLAIYFFFMGISSLLNNLLRDFYSKGYTPMAIVTIGLTAPAVLLILLLSIIGIGFDFFPDVAPDIVIDVAPDVTPDIDAVHHNSNVVEVKSYMRSNPDGIVENNLSYTGEKSIGTPEPSGYHSVKSHIRTAPDGIVENNLSFTGEKSIGTPETSGNHSTNAYIRTAPDGIVESNLPYKNARVSPTEITGRSLVTTEVSNTTNFVTTSTATIISKKKEEDRMTSNNSLFEMDSFVLISSGSFYLGAESRNKRAELIEKPQIRVKITKDFLIGKYPVTQKLWVKVMKNNPSNFQGEDNPVERVNWFDCINFCNKLSQLEGLETCYETVEGQVHFKIGANGYRLPTEAEWEYVAKGGGSFTPQHLERYGWVASNSNKRTHPVGLKEPNNLGVYDMIGNVWEWCVDSADGDAYKSYTKKKLIVDPMIVSASKKRVSRGGCWQTKSQNLRITTRAFPKKGSRYDDMGFRLVRTIRT